MGLKVEKENPADVVEKLSKFTKGMVKDDGEMIPSVFYSVDGQETAVLCYAREDMKQVIAALRRSRVDWVAIAVVGWMSDMSKMNQSDFAGFPDNYVWGDIKRSPNKKRVLLIQARTGGKTYTRVYEVIKSRSHFAFKTINIPPEEKINGYLSV